MVIVYTHNMKKMIDILDYEGLYATGNFSAREIGIKFNVSKGCIYSIVYGVSWKHII